MNGNAIVGQSGGPTSVINSSLAGVFKTAKDLGVKTVYGMRNGIQGLLAERYVKLEDYIHNDVDLELLKRTPSAFLGS
ncbi:MAG: 6-phosphofructokinase, partial [Oscillospiraceae bacterium]